MTNPLRFHASRAVSFIPANWALGLLVVVVWIQVAIGLEVRTLTAILLLLGVGLWLLALKATADGLLGRRRLLVAAVVALVGCIGFPPATSLDINSYALYGRMVSEYGLNPYEAVPRDIAFDAWYSRTSYFWSDTPSVYGPAFTGISTSVMAVAGESYTVARLAFQGLAGLALLGAAVLVGRRSLTAAAFVGLNPLLLTFGVNDAHCDLLVGLAVLSGALLLRKSHFVAAGAVLALATAIKFSAVPAIAGAAVWLLFSSSSDSSKPLRAVTKMVGAFAVTMAAALALGGGLTSLQALGGAADRLSRFSLWSPSRGLLGELSANGSTIAGVSIDQFVGATASLSVAIVGLFVMARHRRGEPFVAVAAGLVAYQVLGAYTLSWYAAWSLPVLALAMKSWVARLAMAHGVWLAVAYMNGYLAVVVPLVLVGYLLYDRRRGDTLRPCPESIPPVK